MYMSREFARNNHRFYKELVSGKYACLTAPAKRKQVIVAGSFVLRLGQFTSWVMKALAVVTMIGGLVLLLGASRGERNSVFGVTVVATTVIFVLRTSISNGLKRTESRLLAQDCTFVQAMLDAKKAHAEVDALWDAFNVSYQGYPPDWPWRKKDVKTRDRESCSKCGWPAGVSRRKRNLHVHHRVSLARGGNNSLTNLTTLCHICHRDEEGTGHKSIRYQKPRR